MGMAAFLVAITAQIDQLDAEEDNGRFLADDLLSECLDHRSCDYEMTDLAQR
jgi:hypothetical protein